MALFPFDTQDINQIYAQNGTGIATTSEIIQEQTKELLEAEEQTGLWHAWNVYPNIRSRLFDPLKIFPWGDSVNAPIHHVWQVFTDYFDHPHKPDWYVCEPDINAHPIDGYDDDYHWYHYIGSENVPWFYDKDTRFCMTIWSKDPNYLPRFGSLAPNSYYSFDNFYGITRYYNTFVHAIAKTDSDYLVNGMLGWVFIKQDEIRTVGSGARYYYNADGNEFMITANHDNIFNLLDVVKTYDYKTPCWPLPLSLEKNLIGSPSILANISDHIVSKQDAGGYTIYDKWKVTGSGQYIKGDKYSLSPPIIFEPPMPPPPPLSDSERFRHNGASFITRLTDSLYMLMCPNNNMNSDIIRAPVDNGTQSFYKLADIVSTNLACVIYNNNQYIAAGYSGAMVSSTDSANWLWQKSNVTTDIYDIAYGNGRYVAVGYGGDADSSILVSFDGINWPRKDILSGTLTSIIFANGLFVTVGLAGTIRTSSDGITWTDRSANNVPFVLNCIAYGNGKYVTCGDEGTILTSTDSITWVDKTNTPCYLLSIIYAKDQFVVVGSSGYIFTSPDGSTWTKRSSGTSLNLNSITYGNGRYVVVGSRGVVLTSSDGITWTTQTSGVNKGLNAITYDNNQFIAVGEIYAIITSPDGITWNDMTTQLMYDSTSIYPSIALENRFYNPAGVTIFNRDCTRLVPYGDSDTVFASKIDRLEVDCKAVGYDPNMDLLFSYTTDGKIRYKRRYANEISIDSLMHVQSGTTNLLKRIIYNNGLYIIISNGEYILTSSDGVTWTKMINGLTGRILLNGIAYGNGRYVVVGEIYNESIILTSPDGITWTKQPNEFLACADIIYVNNQFIGVGYCQTVITSPDGITWTKQTGGLNDEACNFASICYGNNQYVVVGTRMSEGKILTSPDGITWTERACGDVTFLNSIIYANNQYMVAGDTCILSSPNGIAWTNRATDGGLSVTYYNEQYIVLGRGTILTSPDGITWTKHLSGIDSFLWSTIYMNDRYIFVGTDGVILMSSLWHELVSVEPDRGSRHRFTLSTYKNMPALFFQTDQNSALKAGTLYRFRNPKIYDDYIAMGGEPALFGTDSGIRNLAPSILEYTLSGFETDGKISSIDITDSSLPFAVISYLPTSTSKHIRRVEIDHTSGVITPGVQIHADSGDISGYISVVRIGNLGTVIAKHGESDPKSEFFCRYVDLTSNTFLQASYPSYPSNVENFSNGDVIPQLYVIDRFVYIFSLSNMGYRFEYIMDQYQNAAIHDYDGFIGPYPSDKLDRAANYSIDKIYHGYMDTMYLESKYYGPAESNTDIEYNEKIETDAYGNKIVTARRPWLLNPMNEMAIPIGSTVPSIKFKYPYIIVGWGGTILTSPDGITWTKRTSGLTDTLWSIIYVNNQYVTAGDSIYTSPDGITWTRRPSGVWAAVHSVIYVNNQYVAVGASPGPAYDSIILTSPDSITWTKQTSGVRDFLQSVIYANNQYIIIGGNGTILTSPDSITWTKQTSGTSENIWSIIYVNNQYVTAGESSILTSPDGITWTKRASGSLNNERLFDITYANNQYIAVGSIVLTSPDSITWTKRTSSTSQYFKSIISVNNQYIAVGTGGTILTSPDGITWTKRTSGTTNDLNSIISITNIDI